MQEIHIIKSRRRSLSISVTPREEVIVRAPVFLSDAELRRIIDEKTPWIRTKLENVRNINRQSANEGFLSGEDIKRLTEEAAEYIPGRCRYYAKLIGVGYGRISIRHQKTRWGSCSSEGSLSFNCLLMLCPPGAIDSVVVHELCHRKHMRHSRDFYAEIRKVFPEYDKWNKWLRENGAVLLCRMAGKRISGEA